MFIKKQLLVFFFMLASFAIFADDGYRLWLRYDKISNASLLNKYKQQIIAPVIIGNSATMIAARAELENGIRGLLAADYKTSSTISSKTTLIIGKGAELDLGFSITEKIALKELGSEGYIISTKLFGQKKIVITANTDIGVMYGVFHFLRLLIYVQQSFLDLSFFLFFERGCP